MAGLTWSASAREDLRFIRRYIGRESKPAAARVAADITASVRRLRRFPQSGRVVPEFNVLEYRELIVGSYRVVYRYDAIHDRVAVVMIVHGSRLLPPIREGE